MQEGVTHIGDMLVFRREFGCKVGVESIFESRIAHHVKTEMTTEEKLLETCIHEAAHLAFCAWAGCAINEVSIGERIFEGFTSGGHVMWSMTGDMSSDVIAAIAAAGAAIDNIRGFLSAEEIFESSEADRVSFVESVRNDFPNFDDNLINMMFAKGIASATLNLAEPSKRAEVECIGAAIFNRCVDGAVVLRGAEIQSLFDECRK